jgi:tetratricopeptide (TPR) repeat protein
MSDHEASAAPEGSSARPLNKGEAKRLSRALSRLERGVRALERKPQRAPQLKRLERALREVKRLSARYYQHSSPTTEREAALEARASLLGALKQTTPLLVIYERRLCLNPAHHANLGGAWLTLGAHTRATRHFTEAAACLSSPESLWRAAALSALQGGDEGLKASARARLKSLDEERP